MPVDVELLRSLLLRLEARQVSPRATIIISTGEEAEVVGAQPVAVAAGLDLLLDLDYIDGPGADVAGLWLFRKLTSKGRRFVDAARDQADWEEMKRHRGLRLSDPLRS